ncbi:MAG: Ketopantoate hydroxymethyltransferase, partial [Betaproteobacteria bacterium]|nr:Ketopantoate hydroxymethyltransferase [Betaproteobacteria bacterium]
MKRQGRKIVAVVAWDTPMATIAERAGVDMVSVGDS